MVKVRLSSAMKSAVKEADVMELRDKLDFINFTEEETEILKKIEHALDVRNEFGVVSDLELSKMIGADIEQATRINYVLGWIDMSYERPHTEPWRRLVLKFYEN